MLDHERVDTKPKLIDMFYALDLDRCLADTDALLTLFKDVVWEEASDVARELERLNSEIVQTAGSFDAAGYVYAKLKETGRLDKWEEIDRTFVGQGRLRDMYEPHGRELIDTLKERREQFGLVTKGGKLWQELKIRGMGLQDVPYMITDKTAKGPIYASWKLPDGTFQVPAELSAGANVIAKELTFLDDKAKGFQGIPEGVLGMHVLPADGRELLPSQEGELPSGVLSVRGLGEAIKLINARNRG